ncbi:hypothetical protein [Spirillospora sp. NBC_01491]|uniref:hypothetical protein n=1 Tax=Spirillospora sp. NBC_01491 TaxID=2976007 RepID=UPI002E34B063|nr:hypothetical protein [Spirillospora sp. NBC_01491]
MDSAFLTMRVAAPEHRPWVVVCNTVGVPDTVFDRLVATLADSHSVLTWSTSLTENDEPHGRPVGLATGDLVTAVTEFLHGLGVVEFTGVSWCSGTEILHRLSRSGEFRVVGHCCINGAFNLGPDGPSSDWENTVEPLFRLIGARPDALPGVSALLNSAADAATEGGDPALGFPYSTPERISGYAAQCLEMKRSRTLAGFVDSQRTGLYLSGSEDAVQAPAIARRAAELSASSFELVEGGHHAMMADTQRVCDRVREYCEAVAPERGGR